jgi:hypothetical protein
MPMLKNSSYLANLFKFHKNQIKKSLALPIKMGKQKLYLFLNIFIYRK